MCTIVIWREMHERYPLILAANRDEFTDRAFLPPQILSEKPRIVGGRDCAGGGTWMGVNERGLFVGITNQRTFYKARKDRRSRGELVLRALACENPNEILRLLAQEDGREYNPFNLLFGDTTALYAAYGREETRKIEEEAVPHGLHVLANDRLNSPILPRVHRAHLLGQSALAPTWEAMQPKLHQLLADRELPSLEATPHPPEDSPITHEGTRYLESLCVRTPVFGTTSATLLALQPQRIAHYEFAADAPDRSGFQDVLPLLYP